MLISGLAGFPCEYVDKSRVKHSQIIHNKIVYGLEGKPPYQHFHSPYYYDCYFI